MLGMANEIQITDPLRNAGEVREWMANNPSAVVIDIKVTGFEDNDYFHIIYKE